MNGNHNLRNGYLLPFHGTKIPLSGMNEHALQEGGTLPKQGTHFGAGINILQPPGVSQGTPLQKLQSRFVDILDLSPGIDNTDEIAGILQDGGKTMHTPEQTLPFVFSQKTGGNVLNDTENAFGLPPFVFFGNEPGFVITPLIAERYGVFRQIPDPLEIGLKILLLQGPERGRELGLPQKFSQHENSPGHGKHLHTSGVDEEKAAFRADSEKSVRKISRQRTPFLFLGFHPLVSFLKRGQVVGNSPEPLFALLPERYRRVDKGTPPPLVVPYSIGEGKSFFPCHRIRIDPGISLEILRMDPLLP